MTENSSVAEVTCNSSSPTCGFLSPDLPGTIHELRVGKSSPYLLEFAIT